MEGIDTSAVLSVPRNTTMIGTVSMEPEGDNTVCIGLGALGKLSPAHIQRARRGIENADGLVVSLEIPCDPAIEALQIARSNDVVTVLNMAPMPSRDAVRALAPLADYVVVNEGEAGSLGLTAQEGGEALFKLGAKHVVVTQGSDDTLVISDVGIERITPDDIENVVDTSGAGDAFVSAFAWNIIQGHSVRTAVHRGNQAGGLVVQTLGFRNSHALWVQWSTSSGAAM